MTKIADLCKAIADAADVDETRVIAGAAVLNLPPIAEATAEQAVLILLGLLSADDPELGAIRGARYSALPLTHITWLNMPTPSGLSNVVVEAQDLPLRMGDGPRAARMSRSLLSALSYLIEQRRLGVKVITPYQVRVMRRDAVPFASINTLDERTGIEELALYRNSGDGTELYMLASHHLQLAAEINGRVLDEIADCLGALEPSLEPSAFAEVRANG